MTARLGLVQLLLQESKAQIYASALELAEFLGIDTTSWQPGDPTRSLFHVLSEVLENLEVILASFAASGFLDFAEEDWLTLLAEQVFDESRIEATYATTTVTLTNTGGGLYPIGVGDLTFKNTATKKTYRNTDAGTLNPGPGTTLDLAVTADEAGSDSNSAATEIDALVTSLQGVTVSNATAAVGVDAESDASLRERCRDKLGSLSPNGPSRAYDYVARSTELTGVSTVTRTRADADSNTGEVTIYLASATGAVSGSDVSDVEEAILEWATPLCITPTVVSATPVVVAVTYSLWLYEAVGEETADIEDAIEAALENMFATRPIGGDVIAAPGYLYQSLIESTIREVYPDHAFRVTLSAPASDVSLAISEVATLGAVTPTITKVSDP